MFDVHKNKKQAKKLMLFTRKKIAEKLLKKYQRTNHNIGMFENGECIKALYTIH